ncbi:glycosyltransferase [Alicyclobacillaceae bacterium I2511]|nr:glycosyltransferase [Alicyclobacillaceae bacterium I2511]
MWFAVFFWALALYGALMAVWQGVSRLQQRVHGPLFPLTILLVVQNAEEEIEGLLRLLTLQTLGSWRDYRVRVLDVGSTDGTGQIVQTLMQHSGNLDYVYLHGNEDLIQNITLSCLDTARVSCVYDLRNQDLHSGMSRDIAGLCRGS